MPFAERVAVLLMAASQITCASSRTDSLACPAGTEPDAYLAEGDAVPDPRTCVWRPEVQDYLGVLREDMLGSWRPPMNRSDREIRALFTIDRAGAVERYCLVPGGREARGLRRSVIEVLESFRPATAPSEAVAACLANVKIAGDFRMVPSH